MIIYGEEYKYKKNITRIDVFKRYGLLLQTKSSGTYMLSPLGKMVKDRIVNIFLRLILSHNISVIELPSVLHINNLVSCYRKCSTLITNESSLFVCDALNDAEEALPFLKDYHAVAWVKNYIDTSERMIPSKLRFHSYGLICLISRKSQTDLCILIKEILCSLLGDLEHNLIIHSDPSGDIHICYNGCDEFNLAHIHSHFTHTCSVCGVSVEKLILAYILNNPCNKEEYVKHLFENVLIAYPKQTISPAVFADDEYDFIDFRNIKIDTKCDLLSRIGVKAIHMITNAGCIKPIQLN